jgi:hypothetical protein
MHSQPCAAPSNSIARIDICERSYFADGPIDAAASATTQRGALELVVESSDTRPAVTQASQSR